MNADDNTNANMNADNAAAAGPQRRRTAQKDIPLSTVLKIMREAIPRSARIADEAKETVQKCVTEFIHYVTAKANERAKQERRKTVTTEDLIWAMRALGLGSYAEELTDFITDYRAKHVHGRAASHPLPPPVQQVPFMQGFPVPGFAPGPMNDGAGGSASSSSPSFGGDYFFDPSYPPTNFNG
ncbi:transcriptional activator hap3-like [Ipomoea triloba]|uniref:transcriptional activator hap3-like n=1 Tax=Ipomoea triloba TaxID=35885 RepID=UPI00125E265B|nr:transcriptional activator hap3-like [Ipomoea triloba]